MRMELASRRHRFLIAEVNGRDVAGADGFWEGSTHSTHFLVQTRPVARRRFKKIDGFLQFLRSAPPLDPATFGRNKGDS